MSRTISNVLYKISVTSILVLGKRLIKEERIKAEYEEEEGEDQSQETPEISSTQGET